MGKAALQVRKRLQEERSLDQLFLFSRARGTRAKLTLTSQPPGNILLPHTPLIYRACSVKHTHCMEVDCRFLLSSSQTEQPEQLAQFWLVRELPAPP